MQASLYMKTCFSPIAIQDSFAESSNNCHSYWWLQYIPLLENCCWKVENNLPCHGVVLYTSHYSLGTPDNELSNPSDKTTTFESTFYIPTIATLSTTWARSRFLKSVSTVTKAGIFIRSCRKRLLCYFTWSISLYYHSQRREGTALPTQGWT